MFRVRVIVVEVGGDNRRQRLVGAIRNEMWLRLLLFCGGNLLRVKSRQGEIRWVRQKSWRWE